jgi:hypothetical protein
MGIGLLMGIAGCTPPPDRVIITSGTSAWAPPMQMPAKPEATARIVVFQHGDRARLLPASQPKPVLLLNDRVVGEIGEDALYIQDVPPGEQRITMAIRTSEGKADSKIEAVTHQANVNAGGEWFLEAGIKYYDCSGVRAVNPGNFGSNVITAGSIVASFASLAASLATTTCAADLQLRPKWPTFGHQEIYPLLAKYGASPLVASDQPDSRLPNSGLSWQLVQRVIRRHIDANKAEYTTYIDKSGRGNLLLRDIAVLAENRGNDATYNVSVAVEYLHVDEQTMAGTHVKRPLRYALRADGDWLTVVSWADVN